MTTIAVRPTLYVPKGTEVEVILGSPRFDGFRDVIVNGITLGQVGKTSFGRGKISSRTTRPMDRGQMTRWTCRMKDSRSKPQCDTRQEAVKTLVEMAYAEKILG